MRRFYERVKVDGKWTFRVATARDIMGGGGMTNPYAIIKAELSVPKWKELYTASAKVLHPDVGGDLVAMQWLNSANKNPRHG